MMYSKLDGMLAWTGGHLMLRKGMSFDEDHPLVTERPDLFTDEAPGADVQSPNTIAQRVQTNMQRPGEQRTEAAPIIKAPPRRG